MAEHKVFVTNRWIYKSSEGKLIHLRIRIGLFFYPKEIEKLGAPSNLTLKNGIIVVFVEINRVNQYKDNDYRSKIVPDVINKYISNMCIANKKKIKKIITARVDSDDIINPLYIGILNELTEISNLKNNTYISFPHGLEYINEKQEVFTKIWPEPPFLARIEVLKK